MSLQIDLPSAKWEPFAGPQTLAYNCLADELFFGGAAGGGKTGLVIGLALMRHRRSLILRREAVQCVEIVDQLRRFAGKRGSWRTLGHGGTMMMQDGRVIEVAGCEHEYDRDKYQGRPHDLICFDEAPHFTKSQVQFISAWNRHENPHQRCRIVLAGNPPTTPEGRWIVEEFAPWLDSEYPDPAPPGELRWFVRLKDKIQWVDENAKIEVDGKPIRPHSRTFIPSKLTDNPILSATNYGAKLQAMPSPLREQLLYGDFTVGMEDNPWQVIPTEWVRKAMARWTPNQPAIPQTALGVDVARGGAAKTVIAARYGPWFAPLKKYPGETTPDGPSVATLVIKEHKDGSIINIDVVGYGASAYDSLKACSWLHVVPVNNADGTSLRDKSGRLGFRNLRAASYWHLREALDPNGEEKLMLPPDNELLADLCSPRYKVLAGGIQIEPKPDLIERIGRSPDCADALVLSYWRTRKPGTLRIYGGQPKAKGVRFVVCSWDELSSMDIENIMLVVSIRNPPPLGSVEPVAARIKCLDSLVVNFCDFEPKDYEATWDQPIAPYGQKPADLIMQREHGKRLWGFLTRQRGANPEVIVFQDDGDRRAMSVACAVCDMMGRKRAETVWRFGTPEGESATIEPSNKHVFDTVKAGRAMVM